MNITINLKNYPALEKIKEELLEQEVNDLLKIGYNLVYKQKVTLTSSCNKGEVSEQYVDKEIKRLFPDYSYIRTNETNHCGDGLLTTNNNQKIMIEVKNYQTAVPTKEIEKLKDDMREQNIKYALFVSLDSNITGKKRFDFEEFGDNYKIVFVVGMDKISYGILFLESLNKLKQTITIKNDLTNLNTIIDETDLLLHEHQKVLQANETFNRQLKMYQIKIKLAIKKMFIETVEVNEEVIKHYKDHKLFTILYQILELVGDVKITKKGYDFDKGSIIVQKCKIIIKIGIMTFDIKTSDDLICFIQKH